MAESPRPRKRIKRSPSPSRTQNAEPKGSERPSKVRRLSGQASASGSSDTSDSPNQGGSFHPPNVPVDSMEWSQTATWSRSTLPTSLSPAADLGPRTPSGKSEGFQPIAPSLSPNNLALVATTNTGASQAGLRRSGESSRGSFTSGLSSGRMELEFRLESPFEDVLGTFGELASRYHLNRPADGRVNSYIKFYWPLKKKNQHTGQQGSQVRSPSNVGLESSQSSPRVANGSLSNAMTLSHNESMGNFSSTDVVSLHSPPEMGLATGFTRVASSRSSPQLHDKYIWTGTAQENGPRLVPPGFGLSIPEGQYTKMDRTFFEFYIKNWCPGRSVLKQTNAWHEDFAKMEVDSGVRSAIQSLAGVYIHDYAPSERVVKRINALYGMAENRLRTLLSDVSNLEIGKGDEIITLACLLSMQDVVRVEYRKQAPDRPRWLRGFELGEYFLQRTDPGSRFWKADNAQLSNLRISQSVIVGRAVILAQPLMPLPSPHEFDPEAEAGRFGWLLYGSKEHVYEIHGGCGFSRKLLHVLSQVRYCAARLSQEPLSRVVPITAGFLMQEVMEMRQWSSEASSMPASLTIEWVRLMEPGYVINSMPEMTEVTAEAWRLASLVYLQCRLLRLPRYHVDVQANLLDLASCIKIMPTSGPYFTAQAPLFPVFLLGLLAIDPIMKDVSLSWFRGVVASPVRSSVPPLFTALTNIWQWIDNESWAHPPRRRKELADAIKDREPWWEQLVRAVNDREPEYLCLT